MEIINNEIITATVSALSSSGEGICKVSGKVYFVPFVLPDEKIDFVETKSFKNYSVGKCVKIYNKSACRVEPKCPVFAKCGGCELQHLNYNEQLKYKTQKVKDALSKIGGFKDVSVEACVKSKLTYNYRNKVEMPVRAYGGKIEIGFFENQTRNIVQNDYCYIQSDGINKCLDIIKDYIIISQHELIDETTGRSLVKHIVVREIEDKFLIVIVAEKDIEQLLQGLCVKLDEKLGDNYGIYLNINSKNTSEVFGYSFIHLKGLESLETEQSGIKLSVGPESFFQINDSIREKIYSNIISKIKNISTATVIDAYSGAGLLSGIIAESAKKVYGIEVINEAVDSANELRKHNNLLNIKNIRGTCEAELSKLVFKLSDEEKSNLVIVIDPPRNGCDKKVIEAVAKAGANQILYLSCDPATLARDLKVLNDLTPYKIASVKPYDMFPQTSHVETLVCLSR